MQSCGSAHLTPRCPSVYLPRLYSSAGGYLLLHEGPTLDTLSEREMKTCKADRSRIVGSYGEEVLAIMIRVWKSV